MIDKDKIITAWGRCMVCEPNLIATQEGRKAYLECEYTIGLYCRRDKLIADTIAMINEQAAKLDANAEEIRQLKLQLDEAMLWR